MDGGSLTEVLGGGGIAEPLIAYVMKQCLQALAFLHRNHRLHRDIKSDNVLVDSSGNVKMGGCHKSAASHINLFFTQKNASYTFHWFRSFCSADFGFAVHLTEEEDKRTSVVGTPYWMAPGVRCPFKFCFITCAKSESHNLLLPLRACWLLFCPPGRRVDSRRGIRLQSRCLVFGYHGP
jgi:hypothetical protein